MMTKDEIYMGVLKMNNENHFTMINATMIKEEISDFKDEFESNNLSHHQQNIEDSNLIISNVTATIGDLTTTTTSNEEDNNINDKNIKLSFSVDRLLKNDCNKIVENRSNEKCLTLNNDIYNNDNFSLERINSTIEFDCCKHFDHHHNHHHHQQQFTENYNNQQIINKKFTNEMKNNNLDNKSINDLKYVVRPTPIRISNNLTSSNSTPAANIINNYQTVLKFHQIANQFNIMSPLHSLKSLQPTDVTFRTNNIQHNVKSFANSMQMNSQQNSITSQSSSSSRSNTTVVVNHHNNVPQQANTHSSGKRKRSWSRAVFSNLQRKGLEIQFQQQKYITKPDRRKLANRLNLTDAQVKVWFQNRRMKWRHTQENLKSGQEKQVENFKCNLNRIDDGLRSSSEEEDEIDVVAE